ncbi:MAG TPA: thiamine-phosphate kinase, partial [Candidatus Acetothermia bacterium]|nr:thiamine-phosphate kinase [Candidatus Acetothermia bacterium]
MGELREWELLERIGRQVPAVGDDCAVLSFAGTNLLLTTDLMHQASDFPPGTTPYTMGWRAVAASLSDIAAMGGRPLGVVLAGSAPDWDQLFPELLIGAREA